MDEIVNGSILSYSFSSDLRIYTYAYCYLLLSLVYV